MGELSKNLNLAGRVQTRPDSSRPDAASGKTFTDRIRSILESASEEDAKIFIDLKYAICLKALRMTAVEFVHMHQGTAILKEILGPTPKTKPLNNSILVVYAHVPGLTDLLPEPDLKAIIRYNKVSSDLNVKDLEKRKKLQEHYKKELPKITEEYKKQTEIITMFPRFYTSRKIDNAPQPGQICDVKYFSNSDNDRKRPVPTLMYGEFQSALDLSIMEGD